MNTINKFRIFPIIFVLLLSTNVLGKALPAKEQKAKKEILEKLGSSFENVANNQNVERWKTAARIAAEYEDEEIMNKMRSEISKSDGGPAEALHTHFYEVYKNNPIFFLKSELAKNGQNMEAIARDLLNEVSGFSIARAQAPLSKVKKSDPNFELVEKFRQALRSAPDKK